MNKDLLLTVLFLTLTFSSFSQTANRTEGCVPLAVNFTAPEGYSTYSWGVNGQEFSVKENPAYSFSSPGDYIVSFRERWGGPVIGTIPITVHAAPVPQIAVEKTSCAPYDAQFSDVTDLNPALEITRYEWVFGDGTKLEGLGLENPTHLYTEPGLYNVSLRIETQYTTCNINKIFEEAIEVLSPPVAKFSTDPPIPATCREELEVSFINESEGDRPLTYSWDLDNGSSSIFQNPPSQVYGEGEFSPSLTVSYANFEEQTCRSSTSASIGVGSPKPSIIALDDTMCIYNMTWLRTETPGLYEWDLGGGSSPKDLTEAFIDSITFSSPGMKRIYLTVTTFDGVCTGVDSVDIYVDQVFGNVEAEPSFLCETPGTINYSIVSEREDLEIHWDRGIINPDGSMSRQLLDDPDEEHYYHLNGFIGIKTDMVLESNLTGCELSVTRTDTLWKPAARLMPDVAKGCAPLGVYFQDLTNTFIGNPVVNRRWVISDGTVIDNEPSIYHVFETPGEYDAYLIVETEMGCFDTSYAVFIEVGENLASQIDFEASKTEVCTGEEVTFSLTGETSKVDGFRFNTEGNRATHCSEDNMSSASWIYLHEAGPQDVTLEIDYNGCFTSIAKNDYINVIGPVAKIDYVAQCNEPLDYTFTDLSQNATSVVWSFGDGNTSDEAEVEHSFEESGDYLVTLTASNESGCPASSDTKLVRVRQLKSVITFDSLMCINADYVFSGANSIDNHAECYKGYTWQFPTLNRRPHTSHRSSSNFSFDTTGEHVVKLITTDINGCKDTATSKFKIFDMEVKPLADDYQICNPATVQFTDASTSDTTIAGWAWSFGNREETVSTEQHPAYEYLYSPANSSSSYQVILELTDVLGCKKQDTILIEHYRPTTNISITSNGKLCLGDEATISASDFTRGGSNLEFTWDFGNGTTGEGQSNVILYEGLGPYEVRVNYVEVGSGCSGSRTATVDLQEYPTAAFSILEDTLPVFCDPQNITAVFEGESNFPHDYFWDNGNGISRANIPTFTTSFSKGEYNFSLLVRTSYGCEDIAERTLNIFRPEGDFDMSTNTIYPNTICKGDEITFTLKDTMDVDRYEWYFGDGTIAEDIPEITHRFDFHPEHGQTVARLILWGFMQTGFEGCSNIPEKDIYIREVVAGFDRLDGQDTAMCFSEGAYQFTNTSYGFDDFRWDFGDGKYSTEMNPAHQYEEPGHYQAMLHISGSLGSEDRCVDSMSLDVIVHANPVVEAVGDTVCQGEESHLQVMNPKESSQFVWSPNSYLVDENVPNAVSTTLNSMEYYVLETDSNGCTGTAEVFANVVEPLPLFSWDTTLVLGDEITLPVERPELYIFTWNPEEGLSCTDCDYPSVRPLEDITYTLLVTDSLNCFTSEFDYDIVVKPETFVKLPTTFTPNGDGRNDVIFVNGNGIKELLEFSVFNRWGQLIFQSNNSAHGWDGTFKGQVQNTDVYVYKIKALTWKDEVIQEEGYINLVH